MCLTDDEEESTITPAKIRDRKKMLQKWKEAIEVGKPLVHPTCVTIFLYL